MIIITKFGLNIYQFKELLTFFEQEEIFDYIPENIIT